MFVLQKNLSHERRRIGAHLTLLQKNAKITKNLFILFLCNFFHGILCNADITTALRFAVYIISTEHETIKT